LKAAEAAGLIASRMSTDFAITRTQTGYALKRIEMTGRKRTIAFKMPGTGEMTTMDVPVFRDRIVAEAPALPELAEKAKSRRR